jgi:DNA repair exonuclease SbcCD ATPase subunit
VRKPSPAFQVETFEYVEAGPGVALLRLSGVWPAGDPAGEVDLVAVAGGERVTLAPLPAPRADDGSWRAAYSASPELLGGSFTLEPAGGELVALPAPVEHGAVVEPAPEPEPEYPRQAAESAAAAEALLAEELRRTVGKTEELIERIDGYEHGRVSFEEELSAVRRTHADLLAEAREEHALEVTGLREELDVARRELAAALDDVDALNDHVDTLHDAHSLELGAARQQRDAAEQRHATLERQLAEARAAAEELRAQLDERDALIERARAQVAQGVEETVDLHAAVSRLRDAIAARAREVATAQRRFARTPEALDRSRDELRRDAERIAALERQAEALRDAIAARAREVATAQRRFARTPEALDRSRDELRRDAERIAALERQAEALRDAIHSQLPYSLHASPLQEALPLPDDALPLPEGELQSEA